MNKFILTIVFGFLLVAGNAQVRLSVNDQWPDTISQGTAISFILEADLPDSLLTESFPDAIVIEDAENSLRYSDTIFLENNPQLFDSEKNATSFPLSLETSSLPVGQNEVTIQAYLENNPVGNLLTMKTVLKAPFQPEPESTFWIKAAQLLLSLSILIVLHELGHMVPARLFSTRVEKFYLFFNPGMSIFRYKKVNGTKRYSWFTKKSPEAWEEDLNTTEWGLGWLPLGGYVKIAGMVDESMDKEQMAQPAQPWEFRSKPAWQRLIIMIGGVVVNLILGFLIYMMVLGVWGRDYVNQGDVSHGFSAAPVAKDIGFQDGDKIQSVNGEELFNVLDISRHLLMRDVNTVEVVHQDGSEEAISIPEDFGMTMWKNGQEVPLTPVGFATLDSVLPNRAASAAGLLKGDSILSINGNPVRYWHEAKAEIQKVFNSNLLMKVYRNNEAIYLAVRNDSLGKIGVSGGSPAKTISVSHKDFSFSEAISEGFSYGYWTLHDYVVQFKYVFTKKGATQIGGFGAIGNLFPAAWDWNQFWMNTALISIILAFMNLLPIPALDGGHVLFLLWEMLTGRAVSQKVLERAQTVGMLLLLALLLYANGLDVIKGFF